MQSCTYIPTKQQITSFQHKGFIKLSQVATPEQLQAFRTIFNQAIEKISEAGDKQSRIDDYSQLFTQVTNLWVVDPDTRYFILSKKFAQIAASLLGVKNVRLYHDQALVKKPSAGKTPWHQDYYYWPIDSPNTVTMWIPLHQCPRTRGTMQFVTGSHLSQNLQAMPISEASEAHFQNYIKINNCEVQTYDLDLGDATFHYGRTLHCAHGNTQGSRRQVMTIIFMEDGVRVVKKENMNANRKVDLGVFCPKVECGQVIDSELNPILL